MKSHNDARETLLLILQDSVGAMLLQAAALDANRRYPEDSTSVANPTLQADIYSLRSTSDDVDIHAAATDAETFVGLHLSGVNQGLLAKSARGLYGELVGARKDLEAGMEWEDDEREPCGCAPGDPCNGCLDDARERAGEAAYERYRDGD